MSRNAAILGLGRRGIRWARQALGAGWQVSGFDPDPSAGQALAGTPEWRRETTISATVRKADLVICCLPERLELMQMVIQRAQAEVPGNAVIAVATGAQEIEAVQGCALRPGQVILVNETPGGGYSLDVTPKNDAVLRERAAELLVELAATLGLDASAVVTDQRDAESA